MSQAIRLPAEEGALVLSLHEGAARLGVQLFVGPWRDMADLPQQRVHAGHLGHLSLPFPAHLSVPFCSL
jgi:hypothetical protein